MTYQEALNYRQAVRQHQKLVEVELERVDTLIDDNEGADPETEIGSLPGSQPPPLPPR